MSKTFVKAFVNTTAVPVELYNSDGSVGAAIGAGIGANFFTTPAEAFTKMEAVEKIEPLQESIYNDAYQRWKESLVGLIKMQEVEE